MRLVADFHIHSSFSIATSAQMVPETIWKWAQLKGIRVVGTGDFTHPIWFKQIRDKLEPRGDGLFALRRAYRPDDVPESCRSEVAFILSAEISCIYRKRERTRKVHCLVVLPDLASVGRFNRALARIGNIASDGRPILALDAKELLKITLGASPDAMLIPAHAWTPHFSVLGAASGFNSLEDCFEELTAHIHAIETGLSSVPSMNWRLASLDNVALISNSDAHSPQKMGREATIFDVDLSFGAITQAIKTRKGLLGTVEFFPEEGKYHYDGHRACGVRCAPPVTREHDYRCPECGKRLTVGVMHRVELLADREQGFTPPGAPPYRCMIPLQEILAETQDAGANARSVVGSYLELCARIGNELHILIDAALSDIEHAASALVAEAVARVRSGAVRIDPGYDGEYGRVTLFDRAERLRKRGPRGAAG